VNVERLLEKVWGDIKHLETERHWFLGAFAVLVAGSLAFLSQIKENNVSGISPAHVYGFLALLSLIGLLHALRIAGMLGTLQNRINEIAQMWGEGLDPSSNQFIRFWFFDREPPGVVGSIINLWAVVGDLRRNPLTLGALHVLVYLGFLIVFFFLFVCFRLVPLFSLILQLVISLAVLGFSI